MNDLITSQKYLDGELNKIEKEAFEIKLEHDPDLVDDLFIINEINHVLTDNNTHLFELKVKELINKSRNNYSIVPQIINFKLQPKHYIAASITIFLGVLFYTFMTFNKPITDKLYAQYYVKYDPDIVKRSDSSYESKFSIALNHYINNEYNLALELFKEISASPDHITEYVTLYSGICYMELHDYANAIKTFQSINNKNTIVNTHLEWYTGLSYLKLGDTEKAISIFKEIVAVDGYYSKLSGKILKELSN